jgi:hypothetical protein
MQTSQCGQRREGRTAYAITNLATKWKRQICIWIIFDHHCHLLMCTAKLFHYESCHEMEEAHLYLYYFSSSLSFINVYREIIAYGPQYLFILEGKFAALAFLFHSHDGGRL